MEVFPVSADPSDEIAALVTRLMELLAPPPRELPTKVPNDHAKVLLTIEEAARLLGIGRTKAYALVKSGALASVQIGRLRRIHVQALNEFASHLNSATHLDNVA
jgi:excisionase family DNA binding protein